MRGVQCPSEYSSCSSFRAEGRRVHHIRHVSSDGIPFLRQCDEIHADTQAIPLSRNVESRCGIRTGLLFDKICLQGRAAAYRIWTARFGASFLRFLCGRSCNARRDKTIGFQSDKKARFRNTRLISKVHMVFMLNEDISKNIIKFVPV